MRSFGVVDQKVEEAHFFLCELDRSAGSWFNARHYFSAFVSAARSVTFALQGSMHGVEGFDRWYAAKQIALRADSLARFFHDCRTDTQKVGLSPVVGGGSGPGTRPYLTFGQPEPDRYHFMPSEDVVTACMRHMKGVCAIVAEVYVEFGLVVDPDQAFSAEGLTRRNMSLEDLEEHLGFPRGYTDIHWPHGDKDAERLKLLRRHIPMSGIKPLLEYYAELDTSRARIWPTFGRV